MVCAVTEFIIKCKRPFFFSKQLKRSGMPRFHNQSKISHFHLRSLSKETISFKALLKTTELYKIDRERCTLYDTSILVYILLLAKLVISK
jgi:hypothetical protein